MLSRKIQVLLFLDSFNGMLRYICKCYVPFPRRPVEPKPSLIVCQSIGVAVPPPSFFVSQSMANSGPCFSIWFCQSVRVPGSQQYTKDGSVAWETKQRYFA